jgi:hypothetical protein
MALLDDARKRLRSVLDEIARIAEFEFPYKGSEFALRMIERVFRSRFASLNLLTHQSTPAAIRQACSLAIRDVVIYLPLIGFIIRSTNVRNAFEVFRPLLRMASDVLEPTVPKDQRQTQLVLSAEWQYSPLVFRDVPGLPGFVLIGIPTSESSNPLLLPLAGHELGHSVWLANSAAVQAAIQPLVVAEILAVIRTRWVEYQQAFPSLAITPAQLDTSVDAIETWVNAARWAFEQAEEVFCDCLGLRLFGAGYLEAFAYLLAPGIPGERSLVYPRMLDRIAYLEIASGIYHVTVPPDYCDQFDDDALPSLSRSDQFLLSVADKAVRNTLASIIQQADHIVTASGLPATSSGQVARIFARLKLVVPAEKCACLADILNAAWMAFRDDTFWQDSPQIAAKKDEVLKELVLKNIELFEIEQILE